MPRKFRDEDYPKNAQGQQMIPFTAEQIRLYGQDGPPGDMTARVKGISRNDRDAGFSIMLAATAVPLCEDCGHPFMWYDLRRAWTCEACDGHHMIGRTNMAEIAVYVRP